MLTFEPHAGWHATRHVMRRKWPSSVDPLFFADDLDLLFCVVLSFECEWPDLYPGRVGRPGLDDLALLRRLLLHNVVLSSERG